MDQRHVKLKGCCDKQMRAFCLNLAHAFINNMQRQRNRRSFYYFFFFVYRRWHEFCVVQVGASRGADIQLVMCGARPAVEILNVAGPERVRQQ